MPVVFQKFIRAGPSVNKTRAVVHKTLSYSIHTNCPNRKTDTVVLQLFLTTKKTFVSFQPSIHPNFVFFSTQTCAF